MARCSITPSLGKPARCHSRSVVDQGFGQGRTRNRVFSGAPIATFATADPTTNVLNVGVGIVDHSARGDWAG